MQSEKGNGRRAASAGYRTSIPGILSLLFVAPCSGAGELAYGVGYLGIYSDNLERVSQNPRRDWLNAGIAGIGYLNSGPELVMRLNAQAQYQDYRYDVAPDGTIYYADTALVWNILPQFLSWTVMDRYDQVTVDPTLPDSPTNRVGANVVATGPDVHFRFGPVNTWSLGARYGNLAYAEGRTGYDRYSAYTAWGYRSSAELLYSLNYGYEQVDYEDTVTFDNFQRQDLFARAEWLRFDTSLVVDAGYTSIEQERGSGDDGLTFRVDGSHRLNPESTMGLLVAREFLDPGRALLATVTEAGTVGTSPPPPPVSTEGVADFYYALRAEMHYQYASATSSIEGRVFYRDIDYHTTPRDREETGLRLNLAFSPGATVVPGLFYYRTNIQYQEFTREDHFNETGARLLYRSTRNLSTILEYRYRWQTSSDPLLDYTENGILLSMVYTSNPEIPTVIPRYR